MWIAISVGAIGWLSLARYGLRADYETALKKGYKWSLGQFISVAVLDLIISAMLIIVAPLWIPIWAGVKVGEAPINPQTIDKLLGKSRNRRNEEQKQQLKVAQERILELEREVDLEPIA